MARIELERRFWPCGRCGSVHIRMHRFGGKYVCSCKDCGKESEPKHTMREAYRSWQGRISHVCKNVESSESKPINESMEVW